VIRGGFGVFPIERGIPVLGRAMQTGFSQNTNLVATLNGGQTFLANLANPFPNGVLQPPGASLGTATNLGNAISFHDPRAKLPYDMHWNFNTQEMLPGQFLLEVGYHGSRTVRLYLSRNINSLPDSYLSTLPVRDQTTINYLSASISNPLAGLLPGTSLNGATIGRSSLLVPFPEFGSITIKDPQGYSWFHALQVRLERRFSHGFTTQVERLRRERRVPEGRTEQDSCCRDIEPCSRDSFRKIVSERATGQDAGAAGYLHEYSGLESAGGHGPVVTLGQKNGSQA